MNLRWLAPLLACAAFSMSAGHAWSQAKTESIDLVMPDGKERVRIEIAIEGEAPAAKWNAFLDRWFDYFDTDNDGVLVPREASRIFPIPVPGLKTVPFDFAKADTNADGKVTRAELKAYYRQAGFTPVLAIAEPVSLQNLQIADALFRHLGPDAGGKLTLERFKKAPELLRKLDENEDEILTPAEILSFGGDPKLKAPISSVFAWRQLSKQDSSSTVRLTLGDKLIVDPVGGALQPIPAASNGALGRLRHKQALLAFSRSDANPAKTAATSRQFVLAQFRSVAGKAPAIEKRQTDDDASLQLLADIFPHADRNQDGKLTLTELNKFLGLIEQGVNCTLLVTLTDHGRNLFLHLDTNADGRLDLSELNAASRQVKALGGEKGWTRTQVPHCVHITVQHGFAAGSFGPLPETTPSVATATLAAKRSSKGPAWFQAMDKNGDGFVSPREFLGHPELFRRLDRNGDGLISIEEAEQADAHRVEPPQKR